MTVSETSRLHHLPHAPPPHLAPTVTVETALAHTAPLFLPKIPHPHSPCASLSPHIVFSALTFVYFARVVCVRGLCVRTHSPSGSQSFFSARHIGALIRRFLPLERTVVALVRQTEQQIKIQCSCPTDPGSVSDTAELFRCEIAFRKKC